MNILKSLPLNETKLKILFEIYAEKEDYLRNIEKKTKINPSLLSRNLRTLEESKILYKTKKANGIFYSLTKESAIFLIQFLENYHLEKIEEKHKEIKALLSLMKNNREILDSSNKIILFGSFAAGEVTKESDIDLLFVTNEKNKILQWCREVSSIINKKINPLIYSLEIFKSELKKKEPFLVSIITKIKNRAIVK